MLTLSQKNSSHNSSCKKLPGFKSLLSTMLVTPALVMSMLAVNHKPALSAQNCPSRVYDSAHKYANTIVTDDDYWFFLFPVNFRTSLQQCTYFPREGAFIVHMRINWQHPWEKNKPYSASVRLKSTSNRNWSWKLKYANYNLLEHFVTIGLIKTISQ